MTQHPDIKVSGGNPLEIGKCYTVRHSRKGTFGIYIDAINDEWITGTIVDGKAGAALSYNERESGDSITIRASQCYFTISE